MKSPVNRLRVVVVSPGDVVGEREATQAVADELNRGIAADRRCSLSVWRWETDARPGLHLDGPQGLIDEKMRIDEADIVVGVFWTRFGTPTKDADSGTEHELRRAWAAWNANGRPDVMVYFCERPYTPASRLETDQWGRVLDFRTTLPPQQLWWSYESVAEFEKLLREHLTQFVLKRVVAPAPAAADPSHPLAAPRLRFNLPPVAASFTGRREELDAIDTALGVAEHAVVTQAIAGLGGVGKSQLAAHYVQTRAEHFEIVAWIRAEDGGIRDLAELADRLGARVKDRAPGERAKLALECLGASDARWLLVLDNVDSATQLRGLLPGSGNGRVLVTSRDHALKEFGPVLRVDVFDEDTATAFLVNRAGRPRDEPAARKLARALGCLPLALSHAAAYCQSGTSFRDYLKLLDELPARELFDSHPEQSYARTVASTWKTSIAAASESAPLANDLLEMAACLAPDAIPKSLFRVLLDSETAAQRLRLTLAFNALAQFSLATVDDDTLSVHRLLQRTARDDLAVRKDDRPMLRAIRSVEDAFPRDYEMPGRWLTCERLLPHAVTLADTFHERGEPAARLMQVLNRATGYLHRVGAGPRELAMAEDNLTRARRLLDVDDADALNAREHVGLARWAAGRSADAIAIYEPLLADRGRVLGSDHPDVLDTRNNLALAYASAGRNIDATAILEPLLNESERILGSEHPSTLKCRNNLANTYMAAGRTTDAIAIYEPLLADRGRILGAEHPDTLRAGNNLADAYQAAGRIVEAIEIFETLVPTTLNVLGPEHPDTLRAGNNLGDAYQAAGRTVEAIATYEPLLADRERILGPEHPDTCNTRSNLAGAYESAGRTADAERLRQAPNDAP